MILVSQSYSPKEEPRARELLKCRRLNESSGLFDKVEYLHSPDRVLSFSELYDRCTTMYRGRVCVIANSDILFGSSVYQLRSFCCDGRLVALTRWETHSSPRVIGHIINDRLFSGSQDCWGFLAGSIPPPTEGEIPLAAVGCDQVICGWAVRAGAQVINPALAVRTLHVHAEDTRPEDRQIMSGFFGYPELTTARVTTAVACHEWPAEEIQWELHTCLR